jgi:N-carbamoylputrescine amidase
MKIGICQLPDRLSPHDPAWRRLALHIEQTRPDVMVLNEMPFGSWVARSSAYDADVAAASVAAHEAAFTALHALQTAVIGSRPVRCRDRLANEAFLLSDGAYRSIHHKHYFPQEPGFFERTWYVADRTGFDVVEYRGIRFGLLLCTELMFTEWARHYRRQGAHVIVTPRASGTSIYQWEAAARMAAVVSGCYVLSSNRVSEANDLEPRFGGQGFACSPSGERLESTSEHMPFLSVDINPDLVVRAQDNYPCNVPELPSELRSPSSAP